MESDLAAALESCGYRGRVVSIDRLADLQDAIRAAHEKGLLDEEFYQEHLTSFGFELPKRMPEARSLIIVAFRDPPVRFTFHWHGTPVQLDVPPTYLRWQEKDQQVERALEDVLYPAGFSIAPTLVPKKMLAVCSGLAEYGRNNITYVKGFGSFHRLAAFCSDLPCEDDRWTEPGVMEACATCFRCVGACPTRAIGRERFLVHAERCITFWNEKPEGVAFPDWLEPAWHNCLVGCMHCQTACPENAAVVDWYDEGASFSEAETELLLEGCPESDLPRGLAGKLEQCDLLESVSVSPRNLGVVLREK